MRTLMVLMVLRGPSVLSLLVWTIFGLHTSVASPPDSTEQLTGIQTIQRMNAERQCFLIHCMYSYCFCSTGCFFILHLIRFVLVTSCKSVFVSYTERNVDLRKCLICELILGRYRRFRLTIFSSNKRVKSLKMSCQLNQMFFSPSAIKTPKPTSLRL